MSFPPRFRQLSAGSGDFDSDAAGTVKAGTALNTHQLAPGSLSCLFVVDAETDTITLAGSWQVSHDNSTWYNVSPSNNAANVVLATGTGGADAAVSKVLPAPAEVQGWEFVRAVVTSGVAAGNSVDTYAMTYSYRHANSF